jgi:hypothetical protein
MSHVQRILIASVTPIKSLRGEDVSAFRLLDCFIELG